VPDDYNARLVVLGSEHAYSRDKDSAAEVAAKEILESSGGAPRLFRNTPVFLAADKAALPGFGRSVPSGTSFSP
jgi:hypothetical protein